MEKNIIKRFFKLRISAKNAVFEDPTIGPILSPFLTRDKILLFCNDFNNFSKNYINDIKLSIIFFLNIDNSFFYIVKGPRFSELLKLILNIDNLSIYYENNSIILTELYDLIFFKFSFFCLNFFFNSFLLKRFFLDMLFSIKNLLIINNEFLIEEVNDEKK
jgi:ribosomal protein L11